MAKKGARAKGRGVSRSKRKAPKKATKRAVATKARSSRKAAPRKAAPKKAARKAPARKKVTSTSAAKSRRSAERASGRKAPSLDRARRTVQGDDIVPTPPSTLDLDRTASAARSGRRAMSERLNEHHETSPALTAGDVDADWESAATVGDEAPGGDNPTPDQDIVDDIGKAVGVQYDDNEELKGEAKIAARDKHRWELDPASSEDYGDRKK